jgi:hypothetical protein
MRVTMNEVQLVGDPLHRCTSRPARKPEKSAAGPARQHQNHDQNVATMLMGRVALRRRRRGDCAAKVVRHNTTLCWLHGMQCVVQDIWLPVVAGRHDYLVWVSNMNRTCVHYPVHGPAIRTSWPRRHSPLSSSVRLMAGACLHRVPRIMHRELHSVRRVSTASVGRAASETLLERAGQLIGIQRPPPKWWPVR